MCKNDLVNEDNDDEISPDCKLNNTLTYLTTVVHRTYLILL